MLLLLCMLTAINTRQVHEAFDGTVLREWNSKLQALFFSNRFNSLPGAIGCAMSHYLVCMYADVC